MQALEWQLECEVRGHGVWLHNRHFPPEAGIFVQPYQRWAGGCTVPLGLGPSAGVVMDNLLHSLGMSGKHRQRGSAVKDEGLLLGYYIFLPGFKYIPAPF